MPPYHKNVSKAQQRLLFAKAGRGDVSMADARGRAKATDYTTLPEHVGHAAVRGLKRVIHGKGSRSAAT